MQRQVRPPTFRSESTPQSEDSNTSCAYVRPEEKKASIGLQNPLKFLGDYDDLVSLKVLHDPKVVNSIKCVRLKWKVLDRSMFDGLRRRNCAGIPL